MSYQNRHLRGHPHPVGMSGHRRVVAAPALDGRSFQLRLHAARALVGGARPPPGVPQGFSALTPGCRSRWPGIYLPGGNTAAINISPTR